MIPVNGGSQQQLTGRLAGRSGAGSHQADLLHGRLGCISRKPCCDLCLAVVQQATAKALLIQWQSQGNVLFLS